MGLACLLVQIVNHFNEFWVLEQLDIDERNILSYFLIDFALSLGGVLILVSVPHVWCELGDVESTRSTQILVETHEGGILPELLLNIVGKGITRNVKGFTLQLA